MTTPKRPSAISDCVRPRLASRAAGLLLAGLLELVLPGAQATLVVQIGQNFTGSTLGVDSDARPADANGAIGPNHFVELVNGRFAVFDKTSGTRVQSLTDSAFWAKAGVTLTGQLRPTDPRLAFDAATGRWFAANVDVIPGNSSSNRFLLAVSASNDPTGGWTAFAFAADPASGAFGDFPTLGLDANGVYLSANLFASANTVLGPNLVSIPKADLLASPPTIERRTLLGVLSGIPPAYTPQPVVTQGAASSAEVVLAVGDLGTDFRPHRNLTAYSLVQAADAGTASLSAGRTLFVPAYTSPVNPPQPGGVTTLDNGDARFSATVYRVGDVLYAAHSTEVNSRAAVQWFTLDARRLVLLQSGIIADPALDLFYPSIAANAQGTVVIGCNGCSSNTFVSSFAVVGETVNGFVTFGKLTLLKAGTATYQSKDSTDGTSRWGDYSATSVDPSDPTHFWTIQMCATGASVWSTQITELIAAPLVLSIRQAETNVLLSWPSAATGSQLQTAARLGATNAWLPVAPSPTVVGDQLQVTVPAGTNSAFFRVVKP